MASLYSQIELASVPKHIAIIMDGNGRWANEQQKERTYGHKKGVESVREVLKAANKLGVETLTLYTFSEENWNRPEQEVEALMELLVLSLIKELDELKENHIKLSVIGEVNALPTKVQHTLNEALAATADNSASNLVLALNYSGRREILRATNSLLKKGVTEATEELFQNELYLGNALPYPDLLIRTGGAAGEQLSALADGIYRVLLHQYLLARLW